MYKLYLENNEDIIELFMLYCEGKSFLWKMFFGWRKTNKHGAYFKLTEKQYKRVIKTAEIILEYERL